MAIPMNMTTNFWNEKEVKEAASLPITETPDASTSGEHRIEVEPVGAVRCQAALARQGIYGTSACCENCHGPDGLQLVYVDRRPVHLCCTVIGEIQRRWPTSIECTDSFIGRAPAAPALLRRKR
jgi:hypothetical protein